MNDQEIMKLMKQYVLQPPWMRINNAVNRCDVIKHKETMSKMIAIWESDYKKIYGCLPEEKAQFTAFHDGGCTNLGKE